MKKLLKILVVLIFAFSFLPVYAQEEENVEDQAPVIVDVEGLQAEFVQYTQDPASKDATFEMVLHSNLDSDRVRISWTLTTLEGSGAVFKDKSQVTTFLTIQKGQTYNIPITITPTGKGEIELLGKAESFKAGEAFTVTVKKVFETNSAGEILPLTQEYKSQRTLNLLKNVVIFMVSFLIILFLLFKGFKWFKKWLKK